MTDEAAAARPASSRAHGDAATAMATGSEGAEAGAGESQAREVERPAGWDLWSRQKKIDFRKRHNKVLGPTSGAGVSR
jgi:hypothetical protein